MKLKLLLESFDPRRLLLHVQQLVVDEYPQADVDIDAAGSSYELTVKYFDLKPAVLQLYKDEHDVAWTIALPTTLNPAPFDEHKMTAINIFNAIETVLKASFEEAAVFEDNCDQLTGVDETWAFREIGLLFKHLGTGRLKKAADVHVVVKRDLDDEGLQKLETRYNSTLVNSKNLQNGLEAYILAALE
jgi:hypothetical protein